MITMFSPIDPFFYLHHAFIDAIWAQWQSRAASSKDSGAWRALAPTRDGDGDAACDSDGFNSFDLRLRAGCGFLDMTGCGC